MVPAGADGGERSNAVKAEEVPMDLATGKSLTLGLTPTSIPLGPWESLE